MTNDNLDDIIKENTPRLRSYVSRRISNRDDADDIVQDTFYQLVRTISIMDNPMGKVTSWLYTVAHNLIVNHGKKHREEEFQIYMWLLKSSIGHKVIMAVTGAALVLFLTFHASMKRQATLAT